ncbi:MAG: hypothetical protein A2170_12265 [Deltaproteobacteria bacterium RBG_13_53_10]|nr:MAG: hypothetical protein A2170_12265 [Deltaproteobacteria bacterium RBG_13_53_10]
MDQHGMLGHIMDHCIEVAKVALFLSNELNKRGQKIDLNLVEASSLLHDLTKTLCLKTKEDHAKTGAVVLKALGYVRVGEVVGEHVHLSRERDPFVISEEEVVNYADKRVRHDRIVSLDERFIDLIDRYGKDARAQQRIESLRGETFTVEAKIFSVLGIDPDALEELIR